MMIGSAIPIQLLMQLFPARDVATHSSHRWRNKSTISFR
jgi:hypothetical protein